MPAQSQIGTRPRSMSAIHCTASSRRGGATRGSRCGTRIRLGGRDIPPSRIGSDKFSPRQCCVARKIVEDLYPSGPVKRVRAEH